MALFSRFFHRKPPIDGLAEIAERIYVFDSCLAAHVLDEAKCLQNLDGTIRQLRDSFPDASFKVFNFRDDEQERTSLLADLLSRYHICRTVIGYPREYEGCPLLAMEMIHRILTDGDGWLCLAQHNILILHCERGGWPLLAFILAALLLYRKQYSGERKTLEMIYRQAPRELIRMLSPLNPVPSQIRYLHYVCQGNVSPEWPDGALQLDCIILRNIPDFDGQKNRCKLLFCIYGKDYSVIDSNPSVLFATPKELYTQADFALIKMNIGCYIQGDVVLECISIDADQGRHRQEILFRVMFNTTFVRTNVLILNRDEIDVMWDAKARFSEEFRAEFIITGVYSDNRLDPLPPAVIVFGNESQEIFSTTDWGTLERDAADLFTTQHTSSENMQLQPRQELVSPSKNGLSFKKVTGALERFSPVISSVQPPAPLPGDCSSSGNRRNSIIASNLNKATSLTIQVLQEMTENFSENRRIGQGAYGRVYVGMLENEKIAVKLLYNHKPDIDDENFKREFENLMMLEHKNIVRLVRYCYETKYEAMQFEGRPIFAENTYRALCFEYMQNGSLTKHISDECDGLDWQTRYKIIRGTCEGLKYLHEGSKEPIYHLDLKPDNILLDKDMVPKLADFGLSKLFGDEKTRITQSPVGTIGYLPVEYINENIVSNKLDIFSLGVVMMKIIAGPGGRARSADVPRQEFLNIVHANWKNRLQKTIHSSWLVETYCQQVNICTEIALSCIENDRHKRPTIGDIVLQMNHTADVLDEGPI